MNITPTYIDKTASIVIDSAHYPPLAPKTNHDCQAVDTHEQYDNAYFLGDDVAYNRKREETDPKDKHDAAKNTVGMPPSEAASPVALTH
jgi:hypothetical protein